MVIVAYGGRSSRKVLLWVGILCERCFSVYDVLCEVCCSV